MSAKGSSGNIWSENVKKYAEEHGITFKQALTEYKTAYDETRKVECKEIKDGEVCDKREDCMFNKSKKCQRRPVTTNMHQEQTLLPKPVTHISSKKKVTERRHNPKPKLVSDKQTRKNKEALSPPTPTQPISAFIEEPGNYDILDIARTVKSRICKDKLEKTKSELIYAQRANTKQEKECEDIIYGDFIKKYFEHENGILTHSNLLKGLQHFYKDSKKNDIDYSLTMDKFIRLFPQKNPVPNANYKRQHIFEALCRLLLFFNYDENTFGIDKLFYTSLEQFSIKPTTMKEDEILESSINVGSKAGIVDIFFRTENEPSSLTERVGSKEEYDEWACECSNTARKIPSKKYNYIMIQNKYYEEEKSNISHYDVTRIYTLASKNQEHDKIFDEGEGKIVLMVNNEDAVSSNLERAKQQYNGLLSEYGNKGVIGVKRLNDWFQRLLFDLLKDKLKGYSATSKETKPLLQTRFHQKFIIDCTEKYIQGTQSETPQPPVSKFIWGAVPRSGKSYMIGGLISNRCKRPENQQNDIVIILGAKTETEAQFVHMFKSIEDFSHYNICVGGDKVINNGKPTIHLFSQEYLKHKCAWTGEIEESKFKEKEGKELKTRFEGRSIDLYFDEIHKGGSTDNSQSVIYTFKNSNVRINIFVMVTATFAKPSSKYADLDFIGSGNKTIETIEWSYNDQQHMKHITDPTKLEMFIHTRTGMQKEALEATFHHYREYYGESYLTVLTSEYSKYPELVLLSPQSIEIEVKGKDNPLSHLSITDVRNIFIGNLKCDACTPTTLKNPKPIDFYTSPSNIFANLTPVTNVLYFIGNNIRNYMNHVVKYPIESSHTELWFLPDKNLYPNNGQDCKGVCNSVENEEHYEGDADHKEAKTGIPNIEPLTRGLAFMLTKNNPLFDNYNIFIVHNTSYKKSLGLTCAAIFGNQSDRNKRIGVFDNTKGSISAQIKAFERDSYKNGKSVIILTGAKLRLGISLPCADIAFNFDDIKSIDANYQTMFRVLTEREKPEIKKYGYYFDFNKDRSIQFMYEYNKTYGESKKKSNIKENLEELQSLLFTFNYNGLNIIQKDTKTEVNLYNKLITELKLNEEGYNAFWSKKDNMVSLLKRVLNISDNEVVKELYKVLKMSKVVDSDSLNDKEGIVLVEGAKREKMLQMVVSEGADVPDDPDGPEGSAASAEEDEEDEEDYGEVVNHIAEGLPTIIALLALFSVNTKDEVVCNSIEECLTHSISRILNETSRCTCENIMDNIDSVDVLDCFFNSGKLTDSEIREDKHMTTDASSDDDDANVDIHEDEMPVEQDGGTGKPKKLSKIQKQTQKIKQLRTDMKEGKKTRLEVDAAKSILEEMTKNAKRKYTPRELKQVMELLLKIITDKNEALASVLNNIFYTIREAVETMPKGMHSKDGSVKGKHGLIYGMDISGIEQKILSHLSVRQEEKDKYGEVFTPMTLIDDMFDKLPKEVWSDPDKKWLDPANGIGNFPMIAYIRLMEGLKTHPKYSNDQERSKHIIENMLYMVEINPKNVKISRRIFGSAANICCADFLNEQDKFLQKFGLDKFDVIIGNPPFQDESSSETAQGGHDLYPKFFINSFDLLKENGYLSFINPAKWRAPDKKGYLKQMWDIFISNNALFLKIYGFDETKKIFKGGAVTRIDYYLIQKNTKKYSRTVILDEEDIKHEINIREWAFLPNYDFDTIRKILIDIEHGIKVIYSRGSYGNDKPNIQKVKSGLFKYPVRHTHTIKDGDVLYWSNTNKNGHFFEKKVILGKGLYPYPYNDYKGEYGMSNYSFGIPISSKKEGDDIVEAINSDKFNRLISATKWSSGFTDHNMFKYFRPDFYKQFLGKQAASTKIQAVVRGHQQRQQTRKHQKPEVETSHEHNSKKGGSRTRSNSRRLHNYKRVNNTRKNRDTRKKKGIFDMFY